MKTPPEVRMINEISVQFAHKPHDAAVAAIANHITMFWDPRIRRHLDEYVDGEHIDLSPLSLDAGRELRAASTS